MDWSYLIAAIAVLYAFIDVNYYLRAVVMFVLSKYIKKRINILDESVIYGLCTTNDVDLLFDHMNDARFLRELDFARFDFYFRSGLFKQMKDKYGNIMQGATTLRFRRIVPIFSLYRIHTKVVHWDEKALYLEQKFITTDNFVRAVVLSKQNIVKFNVEELMQGLLGKDKQKPPMPATLKSWLEYNELSSAELRKKD